jgi:hypothetical protein
MSTAELRPAYLIFTETPVASAMTPEGRDALRSPALQAVLAERIEQIERHGHDAHHDDMHDGAEIAAAAAAYLVAYRGEADDIPAHLVMTKSLELWPWAPETFRPSGEVEMLAKAGALILAELDRVIRAQALLEHAR